MPTFNKTYICSSFIYKESCIWILNEVTLQFADLHGGLHGELQFAGPHGDSYGDLPAYLF